MAAWLTLALALIFLLGGVAVGWLRWIGAARSERDGPSRAARALIILVVAGGLIGSAFWWMDEPQSFAWRLAPLASRMLASAGVGFAAAGIYALERGSRRLARAFAILLEVYVAPLAVAILLFHLRRFDWRAPISYAFFAIVGVLIVGGFWTLFDGAAAKNGTGEAWQATPRGARAMLGFVALIAGIWGLALFIWPDGPSSLVFIWRWDALTSRLIAVMLLTLASGAILGLRDAECAAMAAWMYLAYGAGVVLACALALRAGGAPPPAYFLAFSLLTACALALLVLLERARAAKAAERALDQRAPESVP